MIAWTVRAALLTTLCGAAGAAAQGVPPWGPPAGARIISLDAQRPSWDALDLDAPNGMLYAGVRIPVSSTTAVVGEAPLAYFSSQSSSSTVIGNLYVGAAYETRKGFVAAAGVRLQTAHASDDLGFGGLVAWLSDFDRAEAWMDEGWAARGHIGYRRVSRGGLDVGITAGPTVWVFDGFEDEIFGDYRLHAAYRRPTVVVGAEWSGRTLLTGPAANFSVNSVSHLTLGMSLPAGVFWPRASVRFPLDADLRDAGLNYVVGIGFDWRF